MNALLISLADFADYVPFSVHIAAGLVNPHIRDAQTFDVWPLLPAALRDALAAPAAGAAQVAQASGEFYAAEFNDSAATGSAAAQTSLFTDFIRPLLVVESARRMLLWHGAHVSAAGVHTVSDPSTGVVPISNQARTELRADLQAKCAYYRARLEQALRLAYPPAGGATTACGPARLARRPGAGGLKMSTV